MKGLTVRQPWAWLEVKGFKKVENRTWETKYRGPLAIHAGLTYGWALGEDETLRVIEGTPLPPPADLVYGGIIGLVDLVDCVPFEKIGMYDRLFASGPWCWKLENPRAIEPIPFRGKLGLWNVPPEIIREIVNA